MTPIGRAVHGRALAASLALVLMTSLAFVASVSAANAPVFTTQPAGAVVNVAFGTQPVVAIQDGGVTDTGATGTVTLTKQSGPGTLSGCTGAVAVSSGVATFSGCKFDAVGTYTLHAAWSVGGTVNSSSFQVASGTPTKLVFSTQPAGATGGALLSAQPVVQVQDAAGNVAVQDNSTIVHLAIAANPGSGTLTCTGGLNKTVSGGVASFSGCSIDKIGTGYTLGVTSSPAYTAATSTPAFNITQGPGAQLVFTTQPGGSISVGNNFPIQPIVTIRDAGGNTVTTGPDATRAITLSITPGTPTVGGPGALQCTLNPVTSSTGVAVFSGCRINTNTGVAFQIRASATLNSVAVTFDSAPFTVASGPATKVVFIQQPGGGTGGTAWTTQPILQLQDALGRPAVQDNSTVIALSIQGGTPASGGPGTLTCTSNSGTVVNGTFAPTSCRIDKVGVGYRLIGAAQNLTAAQSNPFNVTIGAPVMLSFITQPPALAFAGTPFPAPIQVGITDLGGNLVSTGIVASVILGFQNNPGFATLGCTGGLQANTANGVATFSNCAISTAGLAYNLAASAAVTAPVTTLAPAVSNAINVAAPLAAITVTPSTNVITWGQSVTLNTHFGGNGANRPFALQVSKDNATWSTIAALTTNASGDASFVYRPSDNRYYRASFAGAADLSAANSISVRVVVRQTNSLRPSNGGAVSRIGHGTAITFTSTIRPNRPELPQGVAHFVVYQRTSTGWSKVLDRFVPVDRSNGVAALVITFNTVGSFYVRSQAAPTTFNANSVWSPLVRYDVV